MGKAIKESQQGAASPKKMPKKKGNKGANKKMGGGVPHGLLVCPRGSVAEDMQNKVLSPALMKAVRGCLEKKSTMNAVGNAMGKKDEMVGKNDMNHQMGKNDMMGKKERQERTKWWVGDWQERHQMGKNDMMGKDEIEKKIKKVVHPATVCRNRQHGPSCKGAHPTCKLELLGNPNLRRQMRALKPLSQC